MHTKSIWSDRPAERWKEAFPLGNGHLGAMVYGNVREECICLNEESIWDQLTQDYGNPKAVSSLEKLRQLIFEGQIGEAQKLARDNFISVPKKFGPFLPFGDLIIQESDVTHLHSDMTLRMSEYKNYRRSLDLESGILTVSFEKAGVSFRREYFVSNPDQVLVIRYSHEGAHPLDYQVYFRRGYDDCASCLAEDPSVIFYEDQTPHGQMPYCGAVKAAAITGKAKNDMYAWKMGYTDAFLEVNDTTDFVLYVAISTGYQNRDARACFHTVERAAHKGYGKIKESHVRDFSRRFNRFALTLYDNRDETDRVTSVGEDNTSRKLDKDTGIDNHLCRRDVILSDQAAAALAADKSPDVADRQKDIDQGDPVYVILDHVRQGDIRPSFTELYMNYTRYLLLSSSREGGLPSNLQGVWNEKQRPACESDYHTNINLQINYWTAQAWGLSECEEPFVHWITALLPGGEEAARRTYGTQGWTVHHCSDIFGYAWPNFDVVGLWPMGGPWICRHLYERWAYRRNYEEMRDDLYPVIRGSVQFLLDFLVEAPEGTACPGCLVTNPSVSPENTYIMDNGESGLLGYGCTMDIEIIQDIFSCTLELIGEIQKKEPGFDQPLKEEIQRAQKKLPPVKVSARHGGIQEWIEDYQEADPSHRHVSQLYGVYPGHSITPAAQPQLAEAAEKTIENKFAAGYDGQGWSYSWLGCIEARLNHGDKAYACVCEAYRRHLLPNLMINAHGVPQVSDTFGLPAAILEMLVQSHEGKIVLLPALPAALPNGSVKGLCVRGRHTIDMTWKDGQLQHAVIYRTPDSLPMPVIIPHPERYQFSDQEDKLLIDRQ